MDLKKEYATNKKAEIEGVWKDFGNGCFIKIARIGNPEYKKIFQKVTKAYQASARRGALSEDKANKLMIEVMSKAIILDWKEMYEGSQKIEHSQEECVRILTEYPDLFEQINEIANEMESFKLEQDEELEKN
jgi:hypothetical protein